VSLVEEVRALRSSVGLSRATHVVMVQVAGADALEFLQGACSQTPYLRVGRVRSTLLLRDDGEVFADVLVVNMGDWLFVLAEGPDETTLLGWLEELRLRLPQKQVSVRSMAHEWVVFGVDGPYAWELVVGLLGRSVLGMPYLSLLPHDQTICIRAGRTGEYGYLLAVPLEAEGATWDALEALGAPLDAARVGLEALDVCALEGWHFSMRTHRATSLVPRLTPLELQLQWRVAYAREFIGAAALRARKAEGARGRVTRFVAAAALAPGQRVFLGDVEVGEVLASAWSPTVGATVGSVLLATRFAHPHLDLVASTSEGDVALRTCSANLVDNLSLHVHPHLGHVYANRGGRQ
jgi:glycine cleavage system aminomethyltransferase T